MGKALKLNIQSISSKHSQLHVSWCCWRIYEKINKRFTLLHDIIKELQIGNQCWSIKICPFLTGHPDMIHVSLTWIWYTVDKHCCFFFLSKDGSRDCFCCIWILQLAVSMWRCKWRECAVIWLCRSSLSTCRLRTKQSKEKRNT